MKKNFFFYFMPSLVRSTFGIFVMVPVTTYYLDPKDFGIAAILMVITGLIAPLSSTGVTWVLSAHYYKINEDERKELLFNILFLDVALKVFWALIFWLAASSMLPLVVKDYKTYYMFFFLLSLIGIILSGLWPIMSYAIVLHEKGKTHAFLEMGQYLAGAITTIVCLTLLKLTTVTLFISPIATGAFALLAGIWFMKSYIKLQISMKWLKEIFRIGMPTIPTNLFETVTNTIDRYFIQRWINLAQLGIYSHSKSYQQIFTMGTKAFSRTFVPETLKTFTHNNSPDNLRKTLTRWYGILGISGLFVTLFSYEIIDILTHGKFVAAAPLVPIWFMLMFSYSFGMAYSQYLFLHKKTAFLVYSGITIGAVFIGISAFLIYMFGIMGAVSAAVLSNAVIQLSRRIYARKLGCTQIAEGKFLSIIAVILGVYIINTLFAFGIFERILGYILLSVLIAYRYGLITIIKANVKRVLDYVEV